VSPKDLSTTTAAPKEVKITQTPLNLWWFGLFSVLLGRFPTGSSFLASRSHYPTLLTTLYHFVPHLSCKLLIVKRKLKGRYPTMGALAQTTRHCGLLEIRPQGLGFTL